MYFLLNSFTLLNVIILVCYTSVQIYSRREYTFIVLCNAVSSQQGLVFLLLLFVICFHGDQDVGFSFIWFILHFRSGENVIAVNAIRFVLVDAFDKRGIEQGHEDNKKYKYATHIKLTYMPLNLHPIVGSLHNAISFKRQRHRYEKGYYPAVQHKVRILLSKLNMNIQ